MEDLRSSSPAPSELSFDPADLGRMQVNTINRMRGDLTGYDCPECLNRGYTAILREDGSFFTRSCACMAIRRCRRKMERSGLMKVLEEKTFDSYRAEEGWQKQLKAGTMAFARDPSGWLLLCGQPGSGKTHLCTAVCQRLLSRGDTVRYMPWRDEAARLKFMPRDDPARQQQLDELKEAQVLYVDDLFKTGTAADGSFSPTQADQNLAFELFNYRCNNRLTTIVSTERSPEELLRIDEAVASRIFEMARGHTYSIRRDTARNYRMRGVTLV